MIPTNTVIKQVIVQLTASLMLTSFHSLRYLIEPRSILFGDFVTSYVLDLLSVLKDVDDYSSTSLSMNVSIGTFNALQIL